MSSMTSLLVNITDKEIKSEKWILDTPIKIQDYGKIVIYVLRLDHKGLLMIGDTVSNAQYALNWGLPITTKRRNAYRVPVYKLKEECKQKYDEDDEEVYEHPECWEDTGKYRYNIAYDYNEYMFEFNVYLGMELNIMWKSSSKKVKKTYISLIVMFRGE